MYSPLQLLHWKQESYFDIEKMPSNTTFKVSRNSTLWFLIAIRVAHFRQHVKQNKDMLVAWRIQDAWLLRYGRKKCLKISNTKFQMVLRTGLCKEATTCCFNNAGCIFKGFYGRYRQLFSNFPEFSLQGQFKFEFERNMWCLFMFVMFHVVLLHNHVVLAHARQCWLSCQQSFSLYSI